jgi:hypothetical protein
MKMNFQPFYPKQKPQDKKIYSELILGMAQASCIYTDNSKPYIPYRVAEKMFCHAFSAEDKSRQDIPVDAVKISDGVGIKTFVSGSGFLKYEKVAEFVNRNKYPLNEQNPAEMIRQVSEYRNNRIGDTVKAFSLKNTVYHYLVRDVGKIFICECPMLPIDINSISLSLRTQKGNAVRFKDKYFNYYFHLSKHTLFQEFSYQKKFCTLKIDSHLDEQKLTWAIVELSNKGASSKSKLKKYDYVVLPLYSTRTGDVPEKSGLNQWNAGGRDRDPNELYIPIPKIVHRVKPEFFPPRDSKFTLFTQDGKKFSAKVCQDDSKALMTDPNKDLGKWLLRDILKLPMGHIAAYENLRKNNADTVIIYKINPQEYEISLHSFGSFDSEYQKNNKTL